MSDPHYVAVMTTGGMAEPWFVIPNHAPRKVAGPMGPLNTDRWAPGITQDSEYFLANKHTLTCRKAGDSAVKDLYDFGVSEAFLSATANGTALLLTDYDEGAVCLVRLDPALWQRHLCTALGRTFTAAEHGAISGGIPHEPFHA